MKVKLFIFAILFFLTSESFAHKTYQSDFYFDENSINTEFKNLNQLESFVNQNPNADYKQLKTLNPVLFSNIDLETNSLRSLGKSDLPLGIPPFFWGCVFGVVGILLVYLMTDKDKGMTNKAAIGCAISYGLVGILYIILIATTATR